MYHVMYTVMPALQLIAALLTLFRAQHFPSPCHVIKNVTCKGLEKGEGAEVDAQLCFGLIACLWCRADLTAAGVIPDVLTGINPVEGLKLDIKYSDIPVTSKGVLLNES